MLDRTQLDDESVVGDECHMISSKPDGPRGEFQFNGDYDDYDNLILLCKIHHKAIDDQPRTFTVESLQSTKTTHENWVNETLSFSSDVVIVEEPSSPAPNIDDKPTENFGQIELPRKSYRLEGDCIQRTVTLLDNKQQQQHQSSLTLLKQCESSNRILVLSSAGLGKSVELIRLAEQYPILNPGVVPILVRLNLFTNEEIENSLTKELPGWERIDPGKLLLIFDGLDEVHISQFDFAIKKLLLFAHLEKFKQTHIVISCRDNFYNSEFSQRYADSEPFAVVKLNELRYLQIDEYITHKLGKTKAGSFNSQVHEKGMWDMLSNPFMLTHMIRIYDSDGDFPETKADLFESLIKHRIEADQKRSATIGINLVKNTVLIQKQVEHIALIMETIGKNYLHDADLQTIVPDLDTRNLIEHCSLLNRNISSNTWQFEHNNFQEFLAARMLKRKTFNELQAFIGIPEGFERIRPTWVNTLTFLFLVIPKDSPVFQSLLDWVVQSDKELLLRIEKIRLDIGIRERIFKAILEDYQGKGIYTRSEKFDQHQLARFVSDSETLVDFLIQRFIDNESSLVRSEILMLLPEFNNIQDKKDSLKPLLLKTLLASDTTEDVRYFCIHALATLNWQEKTSFRKILKVLNLQSSQYDRAGVYRYLRDSQFLEENLELVFEMITYDTGPKVGEMDFGDESIYRDECLMVVRSAKGLKRLCSFFKDKLDPYGDDDLLRKHLNGFLVNCEVHVKAGHKDLFLALLKLLRLAVASHQEAYVPFFREFFERVGKLQEACLIYFDDLKNSASISAMASIADRAFVDYLLDRFKVRKLSKKRWHIILREFLYYSPNSQHDYFYQELNRSSGNKFLYALRPDWSAIQRKRTARDLDLILNKELFLSSVQKIFQLEETETMDKQKLIDFRKVYIRGDDEGKRYDNNVAVERLRRFDRAVTYEEVAKFYESHSEWVWFQITTLLMYDLENRIELSEREKSFLHSWCIENIPSMDFWNEYKYPQIYAAYFVSRFNFTFSDEVYLSFLGVFGSHFPVKQSRSLGAKDQRNLADWLEEKVGVSKVKDQVFSNLEKGIKIQTVFRRHLALAKKYKLREVRGSLVKYFSDPTFLKEEMLASTLEDFLELGGDSKKVSGFLYNGRLTGHDRMSLIDALVKVKSSDVREFLIEELQGDENEDKKLEYAKHLMKFGESAGLEYYRTWVEKYQTYHDWIDGRYFTAIPSNESLPILLKILEYRFLPGFKLEQLHTQVGDLAAAIVFIASQSEKGYQIVRSKLLEFIEKYNAKWLYNYVGRLDDQFQSLKITERSLEEIMRLVDGAL